jgi:hypothetical protein
MAEQLPVAEEGQIDHHTIDRYTAAHAGVGFIMGLLRAPWWLAVGTAVGWELVEAPLKNSHPSWFFQPTQDTPANAVVDAAAWVLGWGIAYRLTDRYPIQTARPVEPKQAKVTFRTL